MAIIKVINRLVSSSGEARDDVVNTFHLETTGDFTIPAFPDGVAAAWTNMFNAMRSSLTGIVQSNHVMRFYDLADPKPRAPLAERLWNFTTAPTTTGTVREVALAVSYQGARASGQSQARRRGRMYFGPITATVLNTDRPSTSLQNTFRDAVKQFIDTVNAIAGLEFVVFSPTNNAAVPVTEVWVDDAWDIQRRRGLAPAAKSKASVTPSP